MLSTSRLAWMLLVLALVGAVAGLFGPHERVWGVDLGATGTAVFGFTLWVGAWLIAWAVVAKALRGPQTELVELDERDLRVQRWADRGGDWALTLVVIAIVLLLAYVPAERLAWWLMPLIAAHVLIGMLIGRALLERAFLVARYALERR